ncbi:MAG: glutamate--tRNA ligase [Deltaproteobacteria bacterium]|nr:glutamate--tRNA ligase [Deltaproteobacteria bacterium]
MRGTPRHAGITLGQSSHRTSPIHTGALLMTVRVRFAPSPTGHLHIGGARTALYNWLYARQHHGTFILRIEDTDRERSTEEYTHSILDGMRWLGLDWDEGPIYQTDRAQIYHTHLNQLLREENAYRCFCTPERLEQLRTEALAAGRKPTYDRRCRDLTPDAHDTRPCCIRFKAPLTGQTVVQDMVRGTVTFDNKELDDLILARSDGTPTYNFVVVVDDVTMQITHVIRGDDHLNNTPRQMLLYAAFNYPTPLFAHLPMILGSDRKRLSKRHGATSVIAYQQTGYLPQALLNYLARLGWSHGDQEIFTLEEMVRAFSFDHVGRAGAIFNPEKLDWVNMAHMKSFSDEELAARVEPFLAEMGLVPHDRDYAARAIASERERAKTLRELAEISAFYFRPSVVWDAPAVAKWLDADGQRILQAMTPMLHSVETWNADALKETFSALQARENVKFLQVAQPLRVALTGTTTSPGIYDVLTIMGKTTVLHRIEQALVHAKKAHGYSGPVS